MRNLFPNLIAVIVFLLLLLIGALIFEILELKFKSIFGGLYIIFVMLPGFTFTKKMIIKWLTKSTTLDKNKDFDKSNKKEGYKIPNKSKGLENNSLADYIIIRKRNILTFILMVVLIKPIIQYNFFPTQSEFVNYDKKIAYSNENLDERRFAISNGFYTGDLGQTPNGEEIFGSSKDSRDPVTFYYPKEMKSEKFKFYLENIFKSELKIFAISLGIMLLLVFLFNDKIKAR